MHFNILTVFFICLVGPVAFSQSCSSGCLYCDDDGTCIKCLDGYVNGTGIFAGECFSCPSGCEDCKFSFPSTTCSYCYSGYALQSDGTCELCPSNCDICYNDIVYPCYLADDDSSSNWWIWVLIGVGCFTIGVAIRNCIYRRALWYRRQQKEIALITNPNSVALQAPMVPPPSNPWNIGQQNQWNQQGTQQAYNPNIYTPNVSY